ncbi:MAG: hypothetical protein U9Q66_00150 [Patescibacteria group bacterium]|nr:hypothetical protein [Patescibacteria group bacterium]
MNKKAIKQYYNSFKTSSKTSHKTHTLLNSHLSSTVCAQKIFGHILTAFDHFGILLIIAQHSSHACTHINQTDFFVTFS